MPGKANHYTPEFKEQAVKRVVDSSPPGNHRSGARTPCERYHIRILGEGVPEETRWATPAGRYAG